MASPNNNPETDEVDVARDIGDLNKTNNSNDKNRKFLNRTVARINDVIGQASVDLYGTDRQSEINNLDGKFNDILHKHLNSLTNNSREDITSFIAKINSSDKKSGIYDEFISNQFMSSFGYNQNQLQAFFYDAYRNRLLEQNDLHEVVSSMIELSSAIKIMTNAIVSADIVEGRMARTLSFDNDASKSNKISIVESIEKKFKLLEKIKKFVIPKTLEYGEYYSYVIPYSRLFSDFDKVRNKTTNGIFREFTLVSYMSESVVSEPVVQNGKKKLMTDLDVFCKEAYKEYKESFSDSDMFKEGPLARKPQSEADYTKTIKSMLGNVTICNDAIPLPYLEEGVESMNQVKMVFESSGVFKEARGSKTDAVKTQYDLFNKLNNNSSEGVHLDSKVSPEFREIRDCYIKMIEPTKMIPIKIMDSIFGYYYIEEDDVKPLANSYNNSIYMTNYDNPNDNRSLIDNIAERIVQSFNKKFLKENAKFKKEIADALFYFNLTKKRLKFQFIPAEFVHVFKIDEDNEGNGQSMLKDSLFYAKLYIMILLFKIMSIILYSNDQKVNYIRQSGIDKNLVNKVEEIARIKQNRQINILDLFNYTTLINKVGNGNELYIPTGRSGERPMETEILSGQDIQLNTELLEMLKNSAILASGVPSELINMLNSVEFAKQAEQSNSQLLGQSTNYQLDFNPSITEWYKSILKYSSNLDPSDIDGFNFVLQPPKTNIGAVKSELINTTQTNLDFIISLIYDDPNNSTDPNINLKIREFKKLYVKDQLHMLNMDRVEELKDQADLIAKEIALKPDPANGDSDLNDLEGDLGGGNGFDANAPTEF